MSIDSADAREEKQLVSLGGTALTNTGKLVKSNYFRFLNHNLDNYDDIQMTPVEAKKIHTHLQKLSTGSSAMVPMYCSGPKCPFAARCPLQQIDKAPIGRMCLIEVELMKNWIIRLFDEYDVDPNNITEVAYINELAEIEIFLMRLNMSLAKSENSELIIDQTVSIGHDGTPIVQKALSPFMDQKERLQNRRSRIIKLMVGDRQEKYKKEAALKVKLDSDPSSRMSAMRNKLEGLSRELDGMSRKLIETDNSTGEPSVQPGTLSPQDLIDAVEDAEE